MIQMLEVPNRLLPAEAASDAPIFRSPLAIASIVNRARSHLQTSSHFSLRGVVCDYRGGALRLRGHVPSYYLKQVAQSLLTSISGEYPVQNELVVCAKRVVSAQET
jgi:hypothetical protein